MRFSSPVLRGGYRIGTMTLALFTFLTVLVPCSPGWLSNIELPATKETDEGSRPPLLRGGGCRLMINAKGTGAKSLFSSPLLWGGCRLIEDLYSKALVDGFPSPILRGSYRIEGVKINDLIIEVLVPLFFGVVIDQQKVTALYLCTYRSRPLFFGVVIDLKLFDKRKILGTHVLVPCSSGELSI